ncbi:MAG: hypothetical protein JRH18_10690 [Deltaproteobacteria bacterium]|nr:hypothetical protein [Deltaproteobacteria bacterium]MBW2152122.1 hypothetical protein [Deltaproteobacteria bacterium]
MKADDTIVYVNGEMVKKSEAVISVYDSGFMHRDGVMKAFAFIMAGFSCWTNAGRTRVCGRNQWHHDVHG